MNMCQYSQSHVGWHFRKLKARTSLLPRVSDWRRWSFELWALSFEFWVLKQQSKVSLQVGLAVLGMVYDVITNMVSSWIWCHHEYGVVMNMVLSWICATHPKWDWLYMCIVQGIHVYKWVTDLVQLWCVSLAQYTANPTWGACIQVSNRPCTTMVSSWICASTCVVRIYVCSAG